MNLWEHSGRAYEPYLEWITVVTTGASEKRLNDDKFTILSAKQGLVAPTLKIKNI